jgi:hypothetical protein
MLIRTLAAAGVTLALAFAPAMAADMKCDDATMMKMHNDMEAMKNGKKKMGAMHEMEMAKASMEKKDEKGCMMHMEKAMKMMPHS